MEIINTSANVRDNDPYARNVHATDVLYATFIIFMLVFGTLGNIMVIGATLVHKVLRTPGNMFIINLACADIFVSFIINAFQLYGMLDVKGYFVVNRTADICVIMAYLCFVTCTASVWTILMISINRSGLMCAGIWAAAAVVTTPPFFGLGEYHYDVNMEVCILSRSSGLASFNIYVLVLMILAPMVTISIFYINIYLYIRNKKRAMRSRRRDVQVTKPARAARTLHMETRLAMALFLAFVAFSICWVPFGVALSMNVGSFTDQLSPFASRLVVIMAHLSSCGLNFTIYGVTNQQFREGYRKLLYSCFHMDQAQASQISQSDNNKPNGAVTQV